MNWIGLREARTALFETGGLATPSARPGDLDALMARGALMVDCAILPSLTEQTLLFYAAKTPWDTALSIALSPEGVVILRHRVGRSQRTYRLNTGVKERAVSVTIVFNWDAPTRQASLSAEFPDTGALAYRVLNAPLPPTLRDARRIMMDRRQCYLAPGVRFAAIATDQVPVGPLPSLDGQTQVITQTGLRSIQSLRPGDLVQTATGGMAQVRWTGAVTLPARARFRPLRVKAPFYGALRDIDCAACQQIRFHHSAVDYLFDTRTVVARAGDLLEGLTPRLQPDQVLETYWHVLLDRPVPMQIHGVACESLNARDLLADPVLRSLSVLRDMPTELFPQDAGPAPLRLKHYEVRSLCESRAA
ncbi:Hint domain-containing protein [Loktanella sp. DSM 29012]|uniref:Hint domain-containing protein n=1 Tax=Loktanella sp. DSM 29012 TaxID=1881056 RepID=UPI0008BE76D5|nr:Hint domain-containing protein [Loktanella sp. DSM 29012]SEP57582.1 Hint domain-containing protein [Loktanella sp. DSM 29012]